MQGRETEQMVEKEEWVEMQRWIACVVPSFLGTQSLLWTAKQLFVTQI